MNKVYIKHSIVPKLRRFTPWVYANEIDSDKEEFQSGEVVALFSKKDGFLGTAYVNPKCAIFARVLSFGKEEIGKKFFHNRMKHAISKRQNLLKTTNAVRLIHSEADFLPGLIIEAYDDKNEFSAKVKSISIDNNTKNEINIPLPEKDDVILKYKEYLEYQKKENEIYLDNLKSKMPRGINLNLKEKDIKTNPTELEWEK